MASKFRTGATPGKPLHPSKPLPLNKETKKTKQEKYDRERRPDLSFSNFCFSFYGSTKVKNLGHRPAHRL